MIRRIIFAILLTVTVTQAQEPIYLGRGYLHAIRNGQFYAYVPALLQTNAPVGANQVLVAAWKAANTAGFPNALAIVNLMGPAQTGYPTNANQVLTDVWNPSNNALSVVCLSGCTPSTGVTGTFTTNTIPKGIGVHALGNSQITDTGTLITLPGTVNFSGATISRCARFDGSGNLVSASGDCTSGATNPAIGGTISGATDGSLLFAHPANTFAQDNANLFWDMTNHRLGLLTNLPLYPFQIGSTLSGMSPSIIWDPATDAFTGFVVSNYVDNGGSRTNLVGSNGNAAVFDATSITGNLIGVYGNANNNGSGTVANMYALYADSGNTGGGATTTNNYGLFVANQVGGGFNCAICTGVGKVAFGADDFSWDAGNANYSHTTKILDLGGTYLGNSLALGRSNSVTGVITFRGSGSGGSAAIGVADSPGTPNEILIPITTGATGGLLQTDGANPQQTSWVTALANGFTATTQASSDNSTKVETTAGAQTRVNNAIAGVNPAIAVQAATTAAGNTSTWTYNNAASGIGATFTGPVNTAITIDGFTFTTITSQRLLVKNDTQSPSGAFNGIYILTALQTGIMGAIFTRALDYDTPSDINNTGAIPVVNGTVNGTTSWLLTSNVTAVGADPLTYVQFSIAPSSVVTTARNINTTAPLTGGGNLSADRTLACATCAIGPGSSTASHIAEFTNTDGVTLKDGGTLSSSLPILPGSPVLTSAKGSIAPFYQAGSTYSNIFGPNASSLTAAIPGQGCYFRNDADYLNGNQGQGNRTQFYWQFNSTAFPPAVTALAMPVNGGDTSGVKIDTNAPPFYVPGGTLFGKGQNASNTGGNTTFEGMGLECVSASNSGNDGLVGTSGGGASATTDFFPWFGSPASQSTTEKNHYVVLPFAATASQLMVTTSSSNSGNICTVKLRHDPTCSGSPVDTTLTVAIPANATASGYPDNTDTPALAANDCIDLSFQIATTACPTITTTTMFLLPTTGNARLGASAIENLFAQNATNFINPFYSRFGATEAVEAEPCTINGGCPISNIQVYVSAAASAANKSTTFTLRDITAAGSGSDTSCTGVITGTVTGLQAVYTTPACTIAQGHAFTIKAVQDNNSGTGATFSSISWQY